ncbi:hypothetical protein HWV01_09925 [Moritella sp. 5]|nr:hypothetical protein HWV01_09925 [Moritella sp. 5]
MNIRTAFFCFGFIIMVTSIIVSLKTGPKAAINGAMFIHSSDGSYNATRHFEMFVKKHSFESNVIFTETGLKNIIEAKSTGEINKNAPGQYTITLFNETENRAYIKDYNKIPLYNEYISANRKLAGYQKIQLVEELNNDYMIVATNGWAPHMIAIQVVVKE